MRWFVNAGLLALVVAIAGCGEHNTRTGIDAILGDTGGGTDGLPPGCDYVEQHDSTNDNTVPAPGIAEPTGLTVATKTTICGTFQSNHYDGSTTVDVDDYELQIAADTDVIVRLTGDGVGAIEYSGLDIYTASGTSPIGGNTVYADHGVTSVHLAAGTYSISPFALASQAITADVPYKIELATDMLDTRCALVPSGGSAETNDGGASTGNNVVTFSSVGTATLTASTADAPEATNITVASTSSNRISGSADDLTTADQYEDKDTFAFATGSANELTVRLTWTGAADLEFYVFEAGSTEPIELALASAAGAETDLFSLKPNTSYWLTIAANKGAGLPAPYAATLCGGDY